MCVMAAKTTNSASAHHSGRTGTSDSSRCVSGLKRSSSSYWMCSGMAGLPLQGSLANGLIHPRLVNRNDGLALQLPDERGQPQSSDAEEGEEGDPGEVEVLGMMRR